MGLRRLRRHAAAAPGQLCRGRGRRPAAPGFSGDPPQPSGGGETLRKAGRGSGGLPMAAGQLVHGAAGIPLRRLPAESGKEPALLPGGDHDHGAVPGAGEGRAGPGDGGALRRLSGRLSIGDGAGPAGAGAVPRRPALRHHREHRRCVPQAPLRLRHGGLRPGLRAAVHFPAAVRGAGHGEAAAPGGPQRADPGGGPGL